MIWHNKETNEVLEELKVSAEEGLSNSEVDERLQKYGPNTIKNVEKPSFKKCFAEQIKNKYCLILIAIAIITSVVCMFNESDYLSPLLIIVIVLINSLVGAYQIFKSQVALNRLRSVASPVATVVREGSTRQISSEELVPGDIIIIKSGEFIPADARLIETSNFSCNEYALTGSDVSINKKADLVFDEISEISERNNMVFSGCVVTLGTAKAVVVETGLNTVLGRSSSIDQQTGEYTLPIQSRLNSTGKIINIVIFVFCALIFAINIIINFRNRHFETTILNSLLNSLALAVAAIPEGLPTISVIAVALGIEQIIKDGIVIKKVSALETLGKTTVICSDKTGIITKNSMTVARIFDGRETYKTYDDTPLTDNCKTILRVAASCSTLQNDATEKSIENACIELTGISGEELDNLYPRVAQIPFDYERKTMTSINLNDGKPVAIVKGAPEILAEKLNNIDSKTLLEANESMALDGLRVVCIAYKPLAEIPVNPIAEEIETDLIFIGLIGLDDPPRETTIEALGLCDTAGIRTIMITGDNITTAKSVARRVGILKDGTYAITGSSLSELTDEELAADIGKYSVFARITPEDKLRIIDALQKSGETVTVTGDDFSDVQALANADIGCAMGKIGTDVARGNADIIIKNSYFSSIVNSIKESRGLFANIQKSVAFLLSCNIAEVAVYLISLLIFKKPIVSAVQLLWINLLTDCAPVVALATAKAEKSVMKQLPSSFKGHLFDMRSAIDIAVQSLYITVITVLAFVIGKSSVSGFDGKLKYSMGITMAFTVLSLIEIFHAFNIRFTGSIFTKEFKFKDFMFVSTVLLLFVVLFLCLTSAGAVFGLTALGFKQLIFALLLSVSIIPFCEIMKIVKRKVQK
ncbi:MAG: cation-transporting P-type ATPase [Clostridia bacterium]|nr:cation-transporting P-type ATPase [Clostridia bacterium]